MATTNAGNNTVNVGNAVNATNAANAANAGNVTMNAPEEPMMNQINNTSKSKSKSKSKMANANAMVAEESEKKGKKGERRFRLSEPLIKFKESKGKIVDSKNHYGMYSDPIPLSAARKCYRRIARSMQLEAEKAGKSTSKVNQRVVFCLLELGHRGVEIDQFYYVGDNKLKKPVTRFVGHNIKTGKNKTITTHVKPHVQALTKAEYMAMTAKPGNTPGNAVANMNMNAPSTSGSKPKSASKSASKSGSKSKSKTAFVNVMAPKNK